MVKLKYFPLLAVAIGIIPVVAFASGVSFDANATAAFTAGNCTISSSSSATSVTLSGNVLSLVQGAGDDFTITCPATIQLTTSPVLGETCSGGSRVYRSTAGASLTTSFTAAAVTTSCGSTTTGGGGTSGGGGGGSSSPSTSTPVASAPVVTTTPPVTVAVEKAPSKTQEVTKELTRKLTLMDSKSKASLVLQKGTKLTVGGAPYAGSVSSPGQLNPSKAIVDFGSPSATGRAVQAVQSKTTGDVVVWLSKPATLTFKMTPAQKGTKYKGKERYALSAYYYNPMTKAFTKLTGKKKGANFAVSDVTYISGPFFLVETDMKPAPKPKAKKTK